MDSDLELMIVMPVYNEQASVRKVVMEWFQEVETWTERFVFLAIALLMASSAIGFRRLKPEDGWQVSGFKGDSA